MVYDPTWEYNALGSDNRAIEVELEADRRAHEARQNSSFCSDGGGGGDNAMQYAMEGMEVPWVSSAMVSGFFGSFVECMALGPMAPGDPKISALQRLSRHFVNGAAADYGTQVLQNHNMGDSWSDSFIKNISIKRMGAAGALNSLFGSIIDSTASRLKGWRQPARTHPQGHHAIIPFGGRGKLTFSGFMKNQYGRFVPGVIRDKSPNLIGPSSKTFGIFPRFRIYAEYMDWHYRVDPYVGSRGVSQAAIAAGKYNLPGRLWFGTPIEARILVGTAAGAGIVYDLQQGLEGLETAWDWWFD